MKVLNLGVVAICLSLGPNAQAKVAGGGSAEDVATGMLDGVSSPQQIGDAQISPLAFVQRFANTGNLSDFEGFEQDRARANPGGSARYVKSGGTDFRILVHNADRDGSDRQRSEIKGLKGGGSQINFSRGQTWRLVYDMVIPSSLKPGSKFCHIHQEKMVNTDGGSSGTPLVTLSLGVNGSTPIIGLRSLNGDGAFVFPTNLAPLINRRLTVELTFKFDTASRGGFVSYVLRDGARTVVSGTRNGVNMWLNEGGTGQRARPKWGIYRSIAGTNGSIESSITLGNIRAFMNQ